MCTFGAAMKENKFKCFSNALKCAPKSFYKTLPPARHPASTLAGVYSLSRRSCGALSAAAANVDVFLVPSSVPDDAVSFNDLLACTINQCESFVYIQLRRWRLCGGGGKFCCAVLHIIFFLICGCVNPCLPTLNILVYRNMGCVRPGLLQHHTQSSSSSSSSSLLSLTSSAVSYSFV